MVIHKDDIIDKISLKTGLMKKDIGEVLDAFRESAYEELKKNNRIVFKNFFRMETVERESRNLYNPKTGQLDFVEGHRSVKMTPSGNLKQVIREAPSDTDIAYDLEKMALEKKMALLEEQLRQLEDSRNKRR